MRMVFAACVVVLVMSGIGASAPVQKKAPAKSPGGATVAVKMVGDNLTFDPPTVTIRRGQTVEWQNNSRGLIHTVTTDPQKVENKADVQLPAGAQPFDSGYMKPGDTYKHRFTVRGTYKYVCVTHEVQHMSGEVVVK